MPNYFQMQSCPRLMNCETNCVKLMKCSFNRENKHLIHTWHQLTHSCVFQSSQSDRSTGCAVSCSLISPDALSDLHVHVNKIKKTTCGFNSLLYNQSLDFFPVRSPERRSCAPDWLSFSCSFLARSRLLGSQETEIRRRWKDKCKNVRERWRGIWIGASFFKSNNIHFETFHLFLYICPETLEIKCSSFRKDNFFYCLCHVNIQWCRLLVLSPSSSSAIWITEISLCGHDTE